MIYFNIPGNPEPTSDAARKVAEWLTAMLVGPWSLPEEAAWEDEGGNPRWVLGTSANNFRLHHEVRPDRPHWFISCRYASPEQEEHLAAVIEWRLGLKNVKCAP